MAEKLKLTCWKNWEEWTMVYDLIFQSNETSQQSQALEIIDVWRSRSDAKLPIAVDCTASLIAVGFLGPSSPCDTPLEEFTKRQTISMALVRFINGMVDQEQKSLFARSVQSIAEELAIPDWLVDLRHDATHASLPSLEILLAGRIAALEWLRTHYWDKTLTSIINTDPDDSIHEELETFLNAYFSMQLSSKTPNNIFFDGIQSKLVKRITSKEILRSSLLPLLVTETLLIPSQAQLQELTTSGYKEPMKRYIELWRPMLLWIQEKAEFFLTDLLNLLLSRFEDGLISKSSQQYLNLLILSVQPNLRFLGHFPAIAGKLFDHCISNPSCDTKKLLRNIKGDLDIPENKYIEIFKLFDVIEPFDDIFARASSNESRDAIIKNYGRLTKYFAGHPIVGFELKEQIFHQEFRPSCPVVCESWSLVENDSWDSIEAGTVTKNLNRVSSLEANYTLCVLPKKVDSDVSSSRGKNANVPVTVETTDFEMESNGIGIQTVIAEPLKDNIFIF